MHSKEELVKFFISGTIHLSKKDYGFFHNLHLLIKDKKPITSNQNKLFDKLITKYQRQLKKTKLDYNNLVTLPWITNVITSDPEFLQAKIFIENNEINIRSPFKTTFIQYFRKQSLNTFVWNKLDKVYKSPFSTFSLKLAILSVKKHYDNIQYCPIILELLEQIKFYDHNLLWNPTLVKNQNHFYVYGINQSLYESISHIELNDDPKTLFNLSKYGIQISPSIIQEDSIKYFASNHQLSYDLDNIDNIVEILKLLEVDHVFTSRDIVYNKSISNEIKIKLLEKGITCLPQNSGNHQNSILFTTNSSGPFYKNVAKVIHLKNSRTINVK